MAERYKGRELNFQRVAESLTRKGCLINSFSRTVDIQGARDLGNGSWGMIDYLINHNNFRLVKGPEVIQ